MTGAKVTNGNGRWPPWADKAIKYGGGVGGGAILIFGFLFPMREDFREARKEQSVAMDNLRSEFRQAIRDAGESAAKSIDAMGDDIKAIRELIATDLRQRITRNEARDEEIMRRLDKLEKASGNGK